MPFLCRQNGNKLNHNNQLLCILYLVLSSFSHSFFYPIFSSWMLGLGSCLAASLFSFIRFCTCILIRSFSSASHLFCLGEPSKKTTTKLWTCGKEGGGQQRWQTFYGRKVWTCVHEGGGQRASSKIVFVKKSLYWGSLREFPEDLTCMILVLVPLQGLQVRIPLS